VYAAGGKQHPAAAKHGRCADTGNRVLRPVVRRAGTCIDQTDLRVKIPDTMAKHGRKQRVAKKRIVKSDYFMQPGKRGAVIVLRKPIGNRATAKVCGIMPTRVHAKMLIKQLEKAESVVKDLFLEATDDGIEALEAVLAACCKEVMAKGPKVRPENNQRTPSAVQSASYVAASDDGAEGAGGNGGGDFSIDADRADSEHYRID
jgi:hypothetical protein